MARSLTSRVAASATPDRAVEHVGRRLDGEGLVEDRRRDEAHLEGGEPSDGGSTEQERPHAGAQSVQRRGLLGEAGHRKVIDARPARIK